MRSFFSTLVRELLRKRRVIFITGKGGVGKTSMVAALAAMAAREGRRVVCAEMGASASTSPLLTTFGGKPPAGVEVKTLDGTLGQRLFLERVLRVKAVVQTLLKSKWLRHFLEGGPGFLDMGMLAHLQHVLAEQEEGALCLVDLPSSGHALALVQLPEFLLGFIPGGPIRRAAKELRDLLTDPTRCGCLLVAVPENLSVEETLELARALDERRLPMLGVLLNRAPTEELEHGELEALAKLSRERDYWGAREVVHALRTHQALTSLIHALQVPLYGFPELALEGPALWQALAEHAVHAVPARSPAPVQASEVHA